MRHRQTRAFRPGLDQVEDRFLAAIHPSVAHLGLHAAGAAVRQAERNPRHEGLITAERLNAQRRAHIPRPARGRHPVMMFGGAGGNTQGVLPSNYRDWGVITIWNTTNQRVTFSASASTYRNGQYFNFTLRPGQFQSYYASFSNTNNAPVFRVTFDPINRFNSITVSHINTVFERTNWYPGVGTEGYPYAIATNVSGLYLTPI